MISSAAPVTLFLLLLTVAVSLVGFRSRSMIQRYSECPYEIIRYGRLEQLVTSGFLHVDLGHLFMNMVTLYSFGPMMEKVLGGGGFLLLYLGSMLAGALFTLLANYRKPGYRAVGASGAISGVLFAFVLFRPFAPLYLFFIPIGIPAIIFAAGYVFASVIGMRNRWGHIGHEAHLGGALGGLLITVLLYPDALHVFLAHFR